MNETIVKIQEENCPLLFGKFWEVKGACSEIIEIVTITFYVFSIISVILFTIWLFLKLYLLHKTFQTIKKETQKFKLEINNNLDAIKDKVQFKLDNFSDKLDRTNNDLNFLSKLFKKIINIFNIIKLTFLTLFKIVNFICFPLIFIYKMFKKLLILLFSSLLFFFKKIYNLLFNKYKKKRVKMIK